jgi:hypothetical protein
MDKYFPIWIKYNKVRVGIKLAKNVSSKNSSDSIVTESYNGELKIAGSNPNVSYPIRINIEIAARIAKKRN